MTVYVRLSDHQRQSSGTAGLCTYVTMSIGSHLNPRAPKQQRMAAAFTLCVDGSRNVAAVAREAGVSADALRRRLAGQTRVDGVRSGRPKKVASLSSPTAPSAKESAVLARDSKPLALRRAIAVPVDVGQLERQKQTTVSLHCGVCGHGAADLKCARCSAMYHSACTSACGARDVGGWVCFVCFRDEESDGVPAVAVVSAACTCCGFREEANIMCVRCRRSVCLGCACVPHSLALFGSLVSSWVCWDCAGVEAFDAQVASQALALRERVSSHQGTREDADAFAQLVFDMLSSCHWEAFAAHVGALLELTSAQLDRGECPSVDPFHVLHYPVSRRLMRCVAAAHSGHKAIVTQANAPTRHPVTGPALAQTARPGGVVRIGYVSSDFVDHPTADLMLSAIEHHDSSQFNVFLYALGSSDDSGVRRRLESCGHVTVRPVSSRWLDSTIANKIRSDNIDVLIDLNGHTVGERMGIFALEPAPVQVGYLGFPGSLGAPFIPYVLADAVVVPDDHLDDYSETVLRLPGLCYQVNSFSALYADVHVCIPTRDALGLPGRPTVVFCNFGRLGRVTQELFSVWMSILRRVPNSVLWLYTSPKVAAVRLQKRADDLGVNSARLILAGPVSPKREHLRRLCAADIYLDTTVYNGHTTGSDALWAGLPMVTLCGGTWASRVGTSLCAALGMDWLSVSSLAEYEDRAVGWAKDPLRLSRVRAELLERRGAAPLFDTEAWVRAWEEQCRALVTTARSRYPLP